MPKKWVFTGQRQVKSKEKQAQDAELLSSGKGTWVWKGPEHITDRTTTRKFQTGTIKTSRPKKSKKQHRKIHNQ